MTASSSDHPDRLETWLQHTGQAPFDADTQSAPVPTPAWRASTVRFASTAALAAAQAAKARGEHVVTYGRSGWHTHAALEALFCGLEGGTRAFLAPSGMAAITLAFLAHLSQGDHALAVDCAYAPVRTLSRHVLSRMGIGVDFVAPRLDALQAALRPNTRVLYLESPGSLLLQMLDLPALCKWAHARGLVVIVDNTWGSGYAYRPLELGADVSVVAATKYVGGHSDLMLGAAVARTDQLAQPLATTHMALGQMVGADDAWLALRGARTLAVRMRSCAEHALAVCGWLAAQAPVLRIHHPAWPDDAGHALWQRDAHGSNGLLSVVLDLSAAQADALIDGLRLFGLGYSWGGYESLVTRSEPEALAHHSLWRDEPDARVRAGAVLRLHVGLEAPEDLIADLDQALARAQRA